MFLTINDFVECCKWDSITDVLFFDDDTGALFLEVVSPHLLVVEIQVFAFLIFLTIPFKLLRASTTKIPQTYQLIESAKDEIAMGGYLELHTTIETASYQVCH